MRRKINLLSLTLVIVMLIQLMFVLPSFAASEIITESSVENSKMVLKVSDERIKVNEVRAINIIIGEENENNNSWTDGIDKQQKGATTKTISMNDLLYRISDGYIKVEVFPTSMVARLLGSQKKDIIVSIFSTDGEEYRIEGEINGVFVDSSETPSTGDDQNSKYLFLDYKYTHGDVDDNGHWAYNQVKELKKLNIVRGTTDGYLFPDAPVSLEEFIALLSRVVQYMDVADNTSSKNVYKYDVLNNKYDEWVLDDYAVLMNAYAIICEESKEKGKTELDKVLTGMENFNSTVTREEAAILMAAFLGDDSNTDNPNFFKDWNNVNDKGRVARLCEYGVMYGTQESDGWYIYPTRKISRIEAIALLSKFMELDKDDILVEPRSETEEKVTVNDRTDPVITFTPNGGEVKPKSKILFNVTDKESNITTIRYAWDTEIATNIYSVNTKTYSKNLTVPNEEGKHVLRVWAKNAGGRATEWQVATYVVDNKAEDADLTPPNITFTVGRQDVGMLTVIDENEKYGIIKAEDRESGVNKIIYNWDNGPEKVVYGDNAEVELPDNTDVIHYIYIKAQNGAGLWADKVVQFKKMGKNYDDTAPEVSINTDLTRISTSDVIKITAKDYETGILEIDYRWDDNPETIVSGKGAFEITIAAESTPQTQGTHVLYVKARNGDGDWSKEKKYGFDIIESSTPFIPGSIVDFNKDNTPPMVTLNTTETNLSKVDVLTVTAEDNESTVTKIVYRWDNNIEKELEYNSFKVTTKIELPTTYTTHYLYIKAQNGAGIWSQERTYIFNIIDSDVPTIEDGATTPNVEDLPINIYIDGDSDDIIGNDGNIGNVVEPGTEIKIIPEDSEKVVQIGYRWNDDEETIVDGKELKIKVPEKVGTHYLYVRVKYKDGAWSGVRKYKFVVVKDIDDEEIKEVYVKITDAKNNTLVFTQTYPWKDIEDGKIIIKAPTKKGSYIMYAKIVNDDNNIIEAKEYKFKIYDDEDDEEKESNLVGKTKFPKTKLVIQLTKDGKEVEDAGMVTYPGNPELIGNINPNVTTLKVEIRNADEKLMFTPKEEIKYYIDFFNGYDKKVNDVKITLRIPKGFEGVSASNDGNISKDKIVWDIGTIKAGGGNRYTAVIKYVDNFKEEVSFVPEVDITKDDKLEETSFVYNMIYDTGSISYGFHSSYVVGYPDGTFQPQGQITRAEMAAMFAKLFDIDGYSGSVFSDLEFNHWANSAVNACVEAGLIDTYGEYFDPASPSTRSTFAIALARKLGVAHIEPIFINSSDTEGHYAMKEMEQLIRLGLVDGYPDGTAGPNNLVTRAEAVTMLNKYAFRGGLTLSNYGNYDSSYVFTDLSNGHWAVNHILEAALDHNYMRTTNGEEISY